MDGQSIELNAAKIRLEAQQEILLTCGKSTIRITPGDIQILSPTDRLNCRGPHVLQPLHSPHPPSRSLSPLQEQPRMSGKPAARITDSVVKGKIVTGSLTVLIGSQGGLACSVCPGGITVSSPVNPQLGAKVLLGAQDLDFALRSEERRVGKEGRSRWS